MSVPTDIAEIFLFANTPGYLFRRMRETPFVIDAASRPDEAQSRLEGLLAIPSWTEDDAGVAYALAVALARADRALPAGAFERLPWAAWIQSLGHSGTSTLTVKAPSWPSVGPSSVATTVGNA